MDDATIALEEMAPGPNGAREGAFALRCKQPGCDREALDKRGIYAMLCAEHKAEKKAGRSKPVIPAALPEPGQRDFAPLITELRDELQRTKQHADRLVIAITALENLV